MSKAYLTIDDGPSEKFESFIDFLAEREIPAVFFNRGDYMEKRPEAVVYGIRKGYIMGNHTYSHRRASKLSLEEMDEEIARTDKILDELYNRAGAERPGKYFRFPYMDRGMGAFFVEPQNLKAEHEAAQLDLLGAGLGHKPVVPGMCEIDRKRKIQMLLEKNGYEALACPGLTLPWYAHTEMAQGIDLICTFSTSDWALLDRHKGKHGFNTIQDLKNKIDTDKGLQDKKSAHVILAHEQAEIYDVTTALIDHFLSRGFEFQSFQ